MNLKAFIIIFILVYVLVSLPEILEIGYVIDWVPGATLIQKFKGYVIDGILNNFVIKTIISCIIGIIVSWVVSKRRVSK